MPRLPIPHGAAVASGVPFKRPKPPKRPGRGKKPNRPPGFLFDDIDAQAEAEADRIVNELLAELGLSRDSARREAERAAEQEMARARAYADALTRLGIPTQIQDIYGRSAGSIGQLAQGFSSEVQGIANQQAAEQANMVSGTGQEGAVRNAGVGMGDVLYGTEGYIPARSLEQMGSAFASQAALQPGFALQFGQMNASKVMQDFIDEVLPEYTDKEAEIRMKRSGLVADAKERRKQEVLERYKMGFATQREVARALGVKDWRKYPNVPLTEQTERPKASASLSKAVGYLVDEYGNPILNRKGKVIPLPKDPAKLERFGNAQSGYWVMNPETGEIQNIIPPVAPKASAKKGYQLKTLKDGSTAVFDPNTGQVTVIAPPPKGSGKKSGLTPTQRRKAVATVKRFARDMLFGYEENGERVSPNMNLGEALQAMSEMIAQGEIDVPWNLARSVIVDFYSRYVKGPPAPKGKPPKGGGSVRIPTSWTGTHVTDGLGWGTKTAEDIMGKPGTPVYLPDDVTVVYYHPTGAQGGGSMLVRTRNGREFWLGHIYANVRPGQRIRRGQAVAYISPDHPRPHVHIDQRRGEWV